jgi:hypothetical protein
MARARNIKPGFFVNDELAELPALCRLLAVGLPCIADRDGRLEDRPKRIKAMLLPYDDFDVNDALDALAAVGFVQRYATEEKQYIQIVKFSKHQNPHKNEAPSSIPAPDKHSTSTRQAQYKHTTNRADSLNLISDSFQNNTSTAARFDEWWAEYPKKVEKKKARAIWKRRKLDKIADVIIADTKERPTACAKWREGYIPNPTTYLNGDRWQDEHQTADRSGQSPVRETPAQRRDRQAREALAAAGHH